MSDIPLIDLQSQLDCPEVEAAIAEQIGQACTNTGFFAISGHGIPDTTIEHCWQASLKFFALSESEKLKVRMPYAGYPYGFAPMEAETLSHSRGQQAPPDLKETFSVGPNTPPPPGISAKEAVFVFSENQWPHRPPDFQEAWQVCHKAMGQLAERLMMLFALALKLPRNHFDDFLRQPISALRANHYPALMQTPQPGQLRAGAHSDYGSLTLLMQGEGASGLEILNRQQEWVPVTPCKPQVVVNLGDLMERWTNGKWVSSLHRVVPPEFERNTSHSRMSLAFFQQPDWDAPIECLPTCLNSDETAKYPGVTSGCYLMERFHSTVLD
jgi:isopenicillin N synthase-like dioxygenase